MATASRSAAPGKDACGNPNTYGPEKAVDGQRDTAWRIDGDGTGESIQLQFAAPIKVVRVGIIAGFDKIDPCDGTDRFFQGRIVRKARLNFDSGQTFDVALDRVRQIQYFDLPDVPSQQLQIIILATDPPPAKNGRDLTAISEIEVWGRP
jgi:hypothetical protein